MELMTVTELSELLRVPKSWIYMRTFAGAAEVIPHIKLGRHLRFRRAEIEAWVHQQHVDGTKASVS